MRPQSVPPGETVSITVVTGVVGVDAHVTGNWIVNHSLREAGMNVVPLGVCVPQEDFVHAAVETNADAIWVTSLYGHAALDCERLRATCVEMGLEDVLLYIGGMLVVGKRDWAEVEQEFSALGFNRAYPPNTLPEVAVVDLIKDVNDKRAKTSEAGNVS
jgi:methylaspartate mutase sigma subunit